MHDRARLTMATFDRAAADYDQDGVDYFATFGRRLVELAGIRPGWRVLDIGSGRGAVLFPAAAAVGTRGRVVGLDFAAGMVAALHGDITSRGIGHAHVVRADAEAPPVTGPFDAVTAGLSLFFLPRLDQALRRLHSALAPGGALAVSSYAANDARWEPVFAAAKSFVPTPSPPSATDGPFGSDEALTATLAAAGFTSVRHRQEPHVTTFTTPDDWWRWTHSHGTRGLWDAVPPANRDSARHATYDALRGLQRADGSVTVEVVVRYTLAQAG